MNKMKRIKEALMVGIFLTILISICYTNRNQLTSNENYNQTTCSYTFGNEIAASLYGYKENKIEKELSKKIDKEELYPSYYHADYSTIGILNSVYVDYEAKEYMGIFNFNSDYGGMDERGIKIEWNDEDEIEKISYYKSSELKLTELEEYTETKAKPYTKEIAEELIDDILSGNKEELVKSINENIYNENYYALIQMFDIDNPQDISKLKQTEEEETYTNYHFVTYAKTFKDNGKDKVIFISLYDTNEGYELEGIGVYEEYYEKEWKD